MIYQKIMHILKLTNILKNMIIGNNIPKESYFWLFDATKDLFTNEQFFDINALSQEDYCKLLLVKLHDDLKNYTFIKLSDEIEKRTNLSIDNAINIFDNIQQKLIKFNKNDDEYKNLNKLIYYVKSIKTDDDYDKNENIIPGIHGEIIKLPIIKSETEKEKKIIITEKEDVIIDITEELAICQHYVTWEKYLLLEILINFHKSFLNFIKDML
jgi:hypothetical protein